MEALLVLYGVAKTNPVVGLMGAVVAVYVASLVKYLLVKKPEKAKWANISVFPVLIMAVVFGLGVRREQVEYAGLKDSLAQSAELVCKSDPANKCLSADAISAADIYMATR